MDPLRNSARMAAFSPRYAGRSVPVTRPCDVPGCPGEGAHRAPKGRDRLTDYYWFCLEHVRLYNQAWDYYAGMTPEEIEAHIRRDATWQRPTWPLGHWTVRERMLREEALHGFAQGEARTGGAKYGEDTAGARTAVLSAEEEALAVLGLDAQVLSFDTIKSRYRQLAKQHHPDANGGDREAEEKLKRINQAYTILKASYGM